jgi:hypothetical protein
VSVQIGPSVSGSLFDRFPCLVVLNLDWNNIYTLPSEAYSRACKRIPRLSLYGNPVTTAERSLEVPSEETHALVEEDRHRDAARVGVVLNEQCARKSRESEQYIVTLLKERAWAVQKRALAW